MNVICETIKKNKFAHSIDTKSEMDSCWWTFAINGQKSVHVQWLTVRSIPIPLDPGSNPVMGNF